MLQPRPDDKVPALVFPTGPVVEWVSCRSGFGVSKTGLPGEGAGHRAGVNRAGRDERPPGVSGGGGGGGSEGQWRERGPLTQVWWWRWPGMEDTQSRKWVSLVVRLLM